MQQSLHDGPRPNGDQAQVTANGADYSGATTTQRRRKLSCSIVLVTGAVGRGLGICMGGLPSRPLSLTVADCVLEFIHMDLSRLSTPGESTGERHDLTHMRTLGHYSVRFDDGNIPAGYAMCLITPRAVTQRLTYCGET